MSNYDWKKMYDNECPKSMPKGERRMLVALLEDLLEHCELTNANFDGFSSKKIDGKTITQFIKSETKIYRESWILPKIKLLLARYQENDND